MSLGKKVVMHLEEIAKKKNVRALSLSPHSYLEKFYSDLGYQAQEGTKQVSRYILLKVKKIFEELGNLLQFVRLLRS